MVTTWVSLMSQLLKVCRKCAFHVISLRGTTCTTCMSVDAVLLNVPILSCVSDKPILRTDAKNSHPVASDSDKHLSFKNFDLSQEPIDFDLSDPNFARQTVAYLPYYDNIAADTTTQSLASTTLVPTARLPIAGKTSCSRCPINWRRGA